MSEARAAHMHRARVYLREARTRRDQGIRREGHDALARVHEERGNRKSMTKRQANKAERQHMSRVAALGCIACRNLGYEDSPAEIHHPRFLAGTGQRADHVDGIPLCPMHHRLGGYGVAFHAGPAKWQETFGTERELLEQVRELLGHENTA